MSETTAIEWCDSTFNPWIGCTRISPACDDCYAARSTPARALGVVWGPHEARRRTSAGNWELPLRWQAQADQFMAEHGRRRRVFCASLADVFDNAVDSQWRADLFSLIQRTPALDWLLLTKRVGNVKAMLPETLVGGELPSNVWLGATICNQEEADRDVPKLLATPARARFLSMEPLLGPVDLIYTRQRIQAQRSQLARAINGETWIDWVIVGGESGPQARPSHPDWFRSLRDQCAAAGVPFLFKQWGEWVPADQAAAAREANGFSPIREFRMLDRHRMHRLGKKAAGRLLDGVEHSGFPEFDHARP